MAKLIFKDRPPAEKWHTGSDFPEVPLTRLSWHTASEKALAYVFFGYVQIDCDGLPTAYGPPGLNPEEPIGNALNDDNEWVGLVALGDNDPHVKNGTAKIDKKPDLLHKEKYPVIQQADDSSPGYYVSKNPLRTGEAHLQKSYADPSKVSFGALSGKLASLGFSLGDYGLAIRHDRNLQSGFFFGDIAGKGYKLGECSKKVGIDLGGSGTCRHFNNNFPVSFILFPGSHPTEVFPGSFPTASVPKEVVSKSDDEIKKAIIPLVRNLCQAENAEELPLLMSFNEERPSAKPRGTSKLEARRKNPSRPRPMHYDNILRGLTSFGWVPFRMVLDMMSLPRF